MPDTDLTVRFGGDTTALNASLAQARQAVAAFAPGVTSTAKAGLDGLGASMAQTRAQALTMAGSGRDLAAAMEALRGNVDGTAVTLRDAGAASREIQTTFASVAAETFGFSAAIGDASGKNRTMVGVVLDGVRAFRDYAENAAYAQRGTEMFTVANDGAVAAIGRFLISTREQLDIFGRIGKAASDFGNDLRLGFSDLDDVQLKAIAAAGGLDAFGAAMARAGEVDRGYLLDLTAKLEAIPGVTDDVATSLTAAMTALPDFSTAATDRLTQFLQTFAKDADQAKALMTELSAAVADTENGGQRLGDIFRQIQNVQAQAAMAADFARKLAPDQAVVMYERIEQSLKEARAVLAEQDASKRRIMATIDAEADAETGVAGHLQRQLDLDEKRTAQLNAQIIAIGALKLGYGGLAEEMRKQAEYADAVSKASTPSSRIAAAEDTRTKLQGNGRRDVGDVSDADRELAIRTAVIEAGNQGVEGMVDVLNVMKNRLAATYGDYGDTLGAVIRKRRQFSGVDDPDGSFDAGKAKTVDPASEVYRRARAAYDQVFGDDADGDTVGGATHYYNPNLAAPGWGATMANRQTRGDHVFGNPDGKPVASEDQDAVAKEAIAQQNTLIREQTALKEGGTDADRLTAAQARENLALMGREVDNAADLVEVRRKAVEAAKDGTPQEQKAATDALTAAEKSYAEAEESRIHATAEAGIAAAKEGSSQRQALELAELARQEANYAVGSAKYEEFEKQKVELTARYAKEGAAEAASAEQIRFDALQRGFKEEQEQIKENARLHVLTAEEGQTATVASLQRQSEAERAHYAELARIWQDQPKEYRKARQQLEEVDARSHQLRAAADRAYLAEVQQTYRQAFEQVGSNLSSSIMGMIQGTTTLKGAMQSAAREILSMFIQSRIRMVADWAAGQAANVAVSASGQSAQTAATAAGEAARTTLVGSAAAAQGATKASTMIGSILASAQETFAGVFGFLSPLLGPAAAGPAGAAQAIVAAKAALPSFAVGHWNLPHDMVANVHAGEMIVPAGPAAMMRAAAGGGASGGGDTHNHNYAFTIQAVDGSGMAGWLKNGGARMIAQAVGAHQKLNPSTR